MKVAFKVDRIGYYRLYGALIEEAFRAGADVVALHRDLPTDRRGDKAYQWADPAAVPAFAGGAPLVEQWRSEAELVAVARRHAVDAMVTSWSWSDPAPCATLRDEGIAWIALQDAFDFHPFPAEALLAPDVTCFFSEWWLELVERYYPDAPRDRLRARLAATGWPQLDTYALVDRAAVRARWGIGERPVVALATYKFHADDPWEQLVFRAGSRPEAVARALLGRRPDLVRAAREGPTYAELIRALGAFRDREGAVLVSKSRIKDRPPRVEQRAADVELVDTSYHPATIVELTAIADILVSFLSTTTLEAVFGGAYAICPLPREESAWLHSRHYRRFRELAGFREAGSFWNYPGVVWQVGVAELIRELPSMRLGELRADATARARYVETFLGGASGHAARTWRTLSAIVDRRRTTRAMAR